LFVEAGRFGFHLGDVPVGYFKEASSITFRRSVRYGLGTLGTVGLYWLDRIGIHHSPLFKPTEVGSMARADSRG
jgi:hypothetical protein